jgi:hypothetical protein
MSIATSPHEEIPPAGTEQPAVGAETTIAGQTPFSPAEWENFRSQDKKAASAFVGILVACYTLGLLFFLIVLLSCL